jgi:hypothetical protein
MNVELKSPPKPSSQVLRLGYDPARRVMYVEYKGTGIYCYHEIMQSDYEKAFNAESLGSYMAKKIIPNHHCEKVTVVKNELQPATDGRMDDIPPSI